MRGLMAAAVVAMGLGTSGGALAQSLAWQVTEVSGPVTIRHGGAERAAMRGATLAPGDVIATAAGGRAVMVHEKDFVTLAARSRATVPGTTEQASGFTKLLQDLGNAVYKIEKRGVPHFGVTTPYLAAVVKGTTFSITVDDRGSTLQVVEGAVEVSTPDGGARDLILPAGVASIAAANPYRLTVHGDHERVIDSPGHPAPAVSQGGEGMTTAVAASAATAPEVVGGDVIVVPVASRPVDLAAFTGGLVSGNAGFTALTATVTQAAKAPAGAAPLAIAAATAGSVEIRPDSPAASQAATTPLAGSVTTVVATVAGTTSSPVSALPAATTPVVATTTSTVAAVTPVATAATGVVTPVVATTTAAVTPVVTTAAAVATPVVAATTAAVTPVVTTTTAVVTPAVTTVAATATPMVTTATAAVTPVVTTAAAAVTPVVTAATAVVTPVVAATTAVTPVVATTTAATTPVTTTVVATVTPITTPVVTTAAASTATTTGALDALNDDSDNGNHYGWTKGKGNTGKTHGS